MRRDEHFDYLKTRGWLLGEYDDAMNPEQTQIVAQDPVDEKHYSPAMALSIQHLRDVERIASYETFICVTGFEGAEEFAGGPENEPEEEAAS